jgi:bifunctional non-homologous end joining protein LigD
VEPLTKVEFTNLNKILYPQLKITKAQVIQYYIKIAPRMLPLLDRRPLMMTRFPDGVDSEGFYEKDAPLGTPPWVSTFKTYSDSAQRELNYVVCSDLDTLVWLANLAALEVHMTLSRVDSFENPDLVLFDVDPEPPATYEDAVDTAMLLKERLDDLSLRSFVKTSGLKGLHVVIPIVEGYTFQQTRDFVHQIARRLTKDSEILVSEYTESKKPGTVFIDYRQNSHGRTMICPYSLRATQKATVSTPLEWDGIKKRLKPEEFTLFNTAKIETNPWEGLFENRQRLEVK